MLREGQLLFTYLHLAPDPEQTRDLMASGATCIAYETVTDDRGGLPLLAPMSEVAGRLAPQVGAWTLQKANGGRGVLMGGVPGVGPARVVVIGGGVVGTHAARIAAGHGRGRHRAGPVAAAAALPRRRVRRGLQDRLCQRRATAELVAEADMVIGAVLIPGAAAPKLVSRAQLSDDEARGGDRGCGDRPGRLLRDLAAPPPIRTRSTRWTGSCITASPTCPAPWRAPRPSRSAMRRCRSCWHWPTRAGGRPARTIRTCWTG